MVVYGGTSAAVTAAVEAARLGRSVIVVSPDTHLGGLSSGGLGFTDTGRKADDVYGERFNGVQLDRRDRNGLHASGSRCSVGMTRSISSVLVMPSATLRRAARRMSSIPSATD